MSARNLGTLVISMGAFVLNGLWACTCISEVGGSGLDQADLVFRGKVEAVRCFDPIVLIPVAPGDPQKVNRPRRFVVTLRVSSAWKGSPGETVSLYHRESNGFGGDCYGFSTEIALELLVFPNYETVVSREPEVSRHIPDWSDRIRLGRKILTPKAPGDRW